MTKYFLGVDGGQSGTTAVIGDENGQVLGSGRAGPANRVPDAAFRGVITASLAAACAQAGLDPGSLRFTSACLGLSGGAAGREALLRQILPADRLLVTDDAHIALAGALAGQPGIVVIAGTGSIAFGRNAQGRTARAGGWGYLFGDEGGAFWIVREALRAALAWEEGWGPPTALRPMFLDATGARNINHLMHLCYTPEFPRDRIASFAIQVNTVAGQGDPTALRIFAAAAHELAGFARAVHGQLFAPSSPVVCSYAGGVFHSRILLNNFRDALHTESSLLLTAPAYNASTGALLEAYQAEGSLPYGLVSRF
jgi:N-acetylglucosamine kinase-like BadF-type ATPase